VTTTLEDRLRDAYQSAARTVRPETIRPGVQYRRGAPTGSTSRFRRRSSLFAPLAAAAAVVAAIGTAVAVPNLVTSHSHRAAPAVVTTPATTSPPPFIVEIAGAAGGSQFVIQQTGTRRITAFILPPRGAYTWDAVAATSSTTFITAATTFSDHVYTSALYQLRLSAKGKLSQLTRLSSEIPGQVQALAASRDGHRIAYTTGPGKNGMTTLDVITDTTTRQWVVPSMGGPGSTGVMSDHLAFAADGSELGFITFTTADTVGPVRAAGAMWLLPVNSAPGSATARSHKVTTGPPDSAPFSTVLSADGQTMYVLSTPTSVPSSRPPVSTTGSYTLSAYSTADGALLRTVHIWTGISDPFVPGMAISGSQLLVWGINGTIAYQVDTVSGAAKPVWLYTLHDTLGINGSAIAW
jgi:hypothetical protein